VSVRFAGWDERTFVLAVDEVTFGLAREECKELFSRARARDIEALELAIAEINVACLGALESPPAELMRRVSDDAHAWLAAVGLRPPAALP
jgi:hypothetical protein